MALSDLLENFDKTGGRTKEASEEEIKEAYAAGRIAGRAYRNHLNKLAQKEKKDEMGVAHNDTAGAGTAQTSEGGKDSGSKSTAQQQEEQINDNQMAELNNKNDQGRGTAVTEQKSEGPQHNQPDTNQDQSVEAAADQLIDEVLGDIL